MVLINGKRECVADMGAYVHRVLILDGCLFYGITLALGQNGEPTHVDNSTEVDFGE